MVTAIDGVLLERSKGFFRGGFLSTDHLEGLPQTAVFIAVSVLTDAALIGAVVALVAWALSWTRLRPWARSAAGALVALGALVAHDIVSYEIARYLGDAFDLGLMFDLVGRNPRELFAVASGHLVLPAITVLVSCGAAAGMVWTAHRCSPVDSHRARREPVAMPVLLALGGVVVFGVAATASDVFENGLLRKPAGQALAFVVNRATDVDFDGYGIVGRSADPAPFNAAVFPYALDVPGNGVDEDGIAGDLPPHAAFEDAPIPRRPFSRKPDVVLFVLESFRADVVGASFDSKPITPVLDDLATRGLSRHAAYSHNGYTVQSRFHLFTGALAAPPGAPTLIDDFKANGYRVAYLSGQDESFGGEKYDIGFSRADVARDAREDPSLRYTSGSTPGSLAVPLTVVERRVSELLASTPPETPLLLCVNFHDTHFPYGYDGLQTLTSATRLPRERTEPGERPQLWAMYTNTAANVDRAIGTVIDNMRDVRKKEPGVVVIADHGESLFDEGFLGHGYGLNDVQTRVPLVVANLPMALPDPFAQADLRGALLAAMTSEPGSDAPFSVPRLEGAPIFQYLGTLTRPSQVAFLESGGRFIYDFRSKRVQAGGEWLRPDELPKSEHDRFLELIRYWERIQLVRARSWGAGV